LCAWLYARSVMLSVAKHLCAMCEVGIIDKSCLPQPDSSLRCAPFRMTTLRTIISSVLSFRGAFAKRDVGISGSHYVILSVSEESGWGRLFPLSYSVLRLPRRVQSTLLGVTEKCVAPRSDRPHSKPRSERKTTAPREGDMIRKAAACSVGASRRVCTKQTGCLTSSDSPFIFPPP